MPASRQRWTGITPLGAIVIVLFAAEGYGQVGGSSQGMGWCPICGRDMPLSHDFTHGAGQDRPQRPDPRPPIRQEPHNPYAWYVVTLRNRTDRRIEYDVRSLAGGGWGRWTLEPGKGRYHYDQRPGAFQIRFTSGGVSTLYRLDTAYVRKVRAEFDDGTPYHFGMKGSRVDLMTGAGEPTRAPAVPARPLFPDLSRPSLPRLPPSQPTPELPSPEEMNARAAHAEGLAAWNRRDWVEALRHFEEQLRWTPQATDAEAWVARAREAVQQAQDEADRKAREQISRVIGEGLRNLADAAPGSAPLASAPDELSFDSVAPGAPERSAPPADGLDFPAVEGPQTLFEKPSPGSAPVPVAAGDPVRMAYAGRIASRPAWGQFRTTPSPHERLPNPLDEARIAREKELLKPLDMDTFLKLNEPAALQLLHDRREAAINEAARRAGDEIGAAVRKFRDDGTLGPNESVLERQRRDPAFAARLESALSQAAENEKRQVARASFESLEQAASYRAGQARLAELKPRLHAVLERGECQLRAELHSARSDAQRQALAIYDNLQRQGLTRDIRAVEDWEQREQTDPKFRQAAEQVQRIREHLILEERRIRARAYDRMLMELNELVGRREPASEAPP